jgi:quercetin dioxygenase-like cupin family protein
VAAGDRYTHLNLLELEDSEAEDGVEARYGRRPMGARHVGVSHMRFAPGFRWQEGHRHREQEEAYLVVGGSGELLLDGEVIEVGRWDLVRIAPEVLRAFAAGPDGLELVAVGGPLSTDEDDGESHPVRWPGVG